MKTDPRGIVLALRRAVSDGDKGMADFLTDTIVAELKRLASLDELLAPPADTDGEEGPWDRICMKCSRPLSDTRPCPASSTTAAAHTDTGEGT